MFCLRSNKLGRVTALITAESLSRVASKPHIVSYIVTCLATWIF